MEVVVFVGLQASGKSMFYRAHFASTHALVSKDLFPNARHKAARQARELKAALAAGRDVVVDNTNASPAERREVLEVTKALHARAIAYWFESDFAACMARNAAREGRARVPDIGMMATAKKLTPPTRDEGFDAIWRVSGPPDARVVTRGEHEI